MFQTRVAHSTKNTRFTASPVLEVLDAPYCISLIGCTLFKGFDLAGVANNFNNFLVACTQLYSSLCRSVGWSVSRLVGLSVCNHFVFYVLFKRKSELICITAPAQQHATVQPCIRPCLLTGIPTPTCL